MSKNSRRLIEKRLLQIAVSLACIVPVTAGLVGAMKGTAWMGGGDAATLDNHFRYLSGLLLGVGLGFLSTIPNIDKHNARFRILTAIVVLGGFCRLAGIVAIDTAADASMIFPLIMELGITPLLFLWQTRFSRTNKN